MIKSLMPFLMLMPLINSCSIRKMAVGEVSDLIVDGIPAIEKDTDLQLTKEAIPGNLKLLEVLLHSDPENTTLLMLLSRLYGSYGFGFIEPQLEKDLSRKEKKLVLSRLNRLYQKGMAYGYRALKASSSSCNGDIQGVEAFKSCIESLDKDDLEKAFWLGFNKMAFLNRNLNSMEALSLGPKAEMVFLEVVKKNESYFFGLSHMMLMAYYGGRSEMMGGNQEKAEKHYKKLKLIAGNQFLLADTYYARFISVQNERAKEFQVKLKAVMAFDDKKLKQSRYRLYNEIAKKMAVLYLQQSEDLF